MKKIRHYKSLLPSTTYSLLPTRRRGTTLVEMLIVMGLVTAFALIGFVNLFGKRGQNDLNSTAQSIAALLREAESRSMVQTSSTSWGVHFENSTSTAPFYSLFASSTYSTSTAQGYYRLPGTVGYVASTLASGASLEITFAQLSGLASASTSIGIYLTNNPGNSSTISVASSGAVSY